MITEVNRYIKLWEARCYFDGLPDEAPKEIDDMVPSYRRIAMALMRGDLSIIGVAKPVTDYYGILKAIELNQPYQKSKRMTQSELRQFIHKLITTLIAKNCYIKGYGDKFRIMDEKHNPVQNISKLEMKVLQINNIVKLTGITYHLNVIANPFAHAIDVRLPSRSDDD